MRRLVLGILSGLLLLVALLFLGYGAWLIAVEPVMRARAVDRAATLPMVTAKSLRTMPSGRTVLVQGIISPDNPGETFDLNGEGPHRLVIYEYAELVSDTPNREGGRTRSWGWQRWKIRPFRLELPDGPVRVVNDNYGFWSSRAGYTEQATYVSGFAVGDEALVEGKVVPGPEGPALRADFVHTGPRDRYVEYRRGGPETGLGVCFGVFVVGTSLPLLMISRWLARRARRPAPSP